MGSTLRRLLSPLAGCLVLYAAAAPVAAQQISSTPPSLSFSNTYVGKASGSKVITITNLVNGITIIASVAFDCPQYGLASGVAPITLTQQGTITHYSIYFQPDSAQTFNCNFILTLRDSSTLSVPLTGKGLTPTATANLSTTSLNFGSLQQGTASASQNVTITNNGTGKLKLQGITAEPLNYVVAPVTLPATINAGASLTLSVNYTPTAAQTDQGTLDLNYDQVPDNGVTLTGTGTAATSLAITTLPLLPQGTTSSPYQVQLQATGGKAPYNWGLSTGSTLPKGLKGAKTGLISGTLDPSVTAGAYTFSAFVKDAKGVQVSRTFTLNLYAGIGANCANTVWNVSGTTTPIVPLNDLGTGTYLGSQGGLYPNGSNVRPPDHDAAGVGFAQQVQPLDSNGNPSSTGKYVFLSLGESTIQNEFARFLPIANADPQKNASLVFVNGAQGGATPNLLADPTSYYWGMILNNYLPQNGVSANQVQVVWMENTDGIASGTFPGDMTAMQAEYESIMQNLLVKFPKVKIVYLSGRVYGAYANGLPAPPNPEPYAYEGSFAVKWAIQDQINGAANLNYDPNKGAVVAPWMAWGPYYWANGMSARSDGLVWVCQDFSSDGTHPSSTWGQLKVATALMNFLKTDTTATPWYFKH